MEQSAYDPQTVELFYPRVIDGKEVWNPHTQTQEGMFVSFDLVRQEISALYGFQFQSYELSKYPAVNTLASLLDSVAALGNIDTSKKGEKGSIEMKKGKEIYLQQGDFLLPGLLFEAKDQAIETRFLMPLY